MPIVYVYVYCVCVCIYIYIAYWIAYLIAYCVAYWIANCIVNCIAYCVVYCVAYWPLVDLPNILGFDLPNILSFAASWPAAPKLRMFGRSNTEDVRKVKAAVGICCLFMWLSVVYVVVCLCVHNVRKVKYRGCSEYQYQ